MVGQAPIPPLRHIARLPHADDVGAVSALRRFIESVAARPCVQADDDLALGYLARRQLFCNKNKIY